MQPNSTIYALSTAPQSAIALIRVSGEEAVSIVQKIFKGKTTLQNALPNSIHFGKIIIQNEFIDEVLVSSFRAPNSYTGENLIEISCHGSLYIIQRILDELGNQGAVLAQPGEFTQRAFLNGKMDLAQAEAVADVIAAESKATHQIAFNQMRGGISTELSKLREQLIHFTSLIELELDFGEEDVEFANRTELKNLVQNIQQQISNLINSFQYGNAIKQGVPVAIVGPPNAGKSSLLNRLVNEERAIVSDIEGTTRDTIEEKMTIEGIQFRFIDTAGIRHSNDAIESIGIERTQKMIEQATIILNVFDGAHGMPLEIESHEKKIISVANKMDLAGNMNYGNHIITISALRNQGIDTLKSALVKYIKGSITPQQQIISNARHHDELKKAFSALEKVEEGLQFGLSGDLLAFHLREALKHIGEITGEIDIDKDILGTIFGKFCIGK